jgi:transcriptional regulator with XRE-family HTH domain
MAADAFRHNAKTASPTTFAALVRGCRLAATLTQEELAEKAGLSVRTIQDIERGRALRPHRNTVRLLANGLGVTDDVREVFVRASRRLPDESQAEPDAVERTVNVVARAVRELPDRHNVDYVAAVDVLLALVTAMRLLDGCPACACRHSRVILRDP